MITTHDADEAAFFSFGPGITTWRTATLNLGMLYVFVNYGLKEGNSWIYQTSILWDSRDVLNFCRNFATNKSARIVDISLLEPFQRDKMRTWRWTRVIRISLYEEDDVEHPVYFSDVGEAVGLAPTETKKKMKTLYKARQMRSRYLSI